MSQGDVMELSDRIDAELNVLRRQKPAQYGNVEAHLKGWDSELADYWISVTRGGQTFPRVYSSEGWEGTKHQLETMPAPPPDDSRRSSGIPASRIPATQPRATDTFRSERNQPAKDTSCHPEYAVIGAPESTPRRPLSGAPAAPTNDLAVTRSRQYWGGDAIAWRRQQRATRLKSIGAAVQTWILQRSARERRHWKLDNVRTPRPPHQRPPWADDDDNYLLLTHIPTGKQWELDRFEDWLKIAKEVGGAAAGRTASASTAEPGTRRQITVITEPEQRAVFGFETCQYCGAAVKAARLTRHLGRCPRRPAQSRRSPLPGAPVVPRDSIAQAKAGTHGRERPNAVTAVHRGVPPEDLGHADPRDASKYWGHHVRDHGRFGSYPVHDGYGDEADP
jgi:hypothetical protein